MLAKRKHLGTPFGMSQNYPDDVDTTSYALKTLKSKPEVAQSVMDEMISPAGTTAELPCLPSRKWPRD